MSQDPERQTPVDAHASGGPEWRDLTLKIHEVVGLFWRWFLVLATLSIVPHFLIWRGFSLGGLDLDSTLLAVIVYGLLGLVVYTLSAALHELIHAATMMVGAHVPAASIRFGIKWREGTAYVHTSALMTIRSYRIVLVMPALLQGLLPLGIGWVTGNGWFTIYAFIMLISAVGDFAMLQLLRKEPSNRLVRDHPTEIGCQVQV